MVDLAPPLPPGDWVDIPRRGRAWRWDSGPAARGPHAPTGVPLHGWTSTAALNWCRCFPPLARQARVVAIDHRGHGRGIRSLKPFTLEDCADDVAALVELLGAGPVVAAGYSMGGPVAQLLWRRHPGAVRGLVMCATAARLGSGALPPGATQAIGIGLSLALATVPAAVRDEGRRRLGLYGSDPATVAPWIAAESAYGSPIAYVQAAGAMAAYDATRWIALVDRPTSVVITTQDRTVAPMRQRALAQAIPGAKAFEVEADHRACVESADLFVPAFLDAVHQAAG
ncbi:MAG: alpha/beta fold hydrolase [Acidimicrobiales bacterium]